MDPLLVTIIVEVIKTGAIATILMLSFAAMTVAERKLLARFTQRYGPNRVGKFGTLQIIADMFKMFFKEELVPGHVNRFVYMLAPCIALVPALIAFAVVPLAKEPFTLPFTAFGTPITIHPWIADINVGIIYLLAIGSLGTYGVVLGGWASNNKYSLLGGLRTSAQMLSYELPMGVAMASVILVTGSMRVTDIVNFQSDYFPLILLIPSFLIFFISGLAEAGRSPFDLPETENELIGGFVTEYGGMKFGLFFGAEYVHTIVFACLTATLFLGGWIGPFAETIPILGVVYFILKVVIILFVIVWIRASVPRVRFDQLMQFCWKFLLPAGFVWLFIVAIGIASYQTLTGAW